MADGERLRRRTGKADTRILLCFEDIKQANEETGMTFDLDGKEQRGALAKRNRATMGRAAVTGHDAFNRVHVLSIPFSSILFLYSFPAQLPFIFPCLPQSSDSRSG